MYYITDGNQMQDLSSKCPLVFVKRTYFTNKTIPLAAMLHFGFKQIVAFLAMFCFKLPWLHRKRIKCDMQKRYNG